MQRRTLLRLGLASAALLGIGGAMVTRMPSGFRGGHLTAAGRDVFAAISRAVVHPLVDADEPTMAKQLSSIEGLIGSLPPAVQADLGKLLAVMASIPGRLFLAGLTFDWDEAPVPDTARALDAMRRSRVTLRVQAYLALRELSLAAHHADPASWSELGYPGPVPIG